MRYERFKMIPCGDRAVMLECGYGIDLEVNRHVRRMFLIARKSDIKGIVETIPCYRSLLVYYDPIELDLATVEQKFREIERSMGELRLSPPKLVEIPVAYGGDFGPDIEFVAEFNGISTENVIELHTTPVYITCMYGFDPGFALLMGLPARLETPRMENPRLKVPAGSVGIGAVQTGIYPFERAGGWRLIGRTPLKMFDVGRDPQILVDIGDEIQFISISECEYARIEKSCIR